LLKRKNSDREEDVIDAMEETHFTENKESKNEQFHNDDHFLQYQ
jgi:hypothetical protein